jgi:hypothetical protein
MNTVQLEVQADRYLLSIDKTAIDRAYLDRLVKLIRVDYLAAKVDFDESVEELGEELHSHWWKANKDRLLKEE